jgi:hypothetical protein
VKAPGDPANRSLKEIVMRDMSYFVLFSYAFFIVAPVIPLVADLVAHTFWEKEHLSTAHHLYGRNHVGIEMQKAEKQTNKETTNNNQKAGLDDLVHRPEYIATFYLKPIAALKQTYSMFHFSLPVSYPDIDYPPPRL